MVEIILLQSEITLILNATSEILQTASIASPLCEVLANNSEVATEIYFNSILELTNE